MLRGIRIPLRAMLASEKVTSRTRQEVERRINAVIDKAKSAGISDDQIEKMFSFDQDDPKKRCGCRNFFVMTFVLVCAGFYIVYTNSSDKCWIDMPNFITKAARPPVDCAMCRDVHEVKRVSNITPDEFERLYAYTGTPVVITDATVNWSAIEVFDFAFLKKIYLETELGTAARRCQFFPYKTEFKNLYEVLEMDEARANLTAGTKPWYVGWSNCHDSTARILRQHYGRPYFLPLNSENNAIDWIFMGGPGDGAQMHVDNVVYPSWQAQIKGIKRWELAPPPECFYSCEFIEVTVYPGDIIVLDTNRWFHKTEVLPGDISLTIGAEYD